MQQANPPTDAEQVVTLRTANAQLRTRVAELERAKDAWRGVAELLVRCLFDSADGLTLAEAVRGREQKLERDLNAQRARADLFLSKIDAARDLLECEPDVSLVDCLRATLAEGKKEHRALCDLLGSETAGMTLTEALRAILASRDAAIRTHVTELGTLYAAHEGLVRLARAVCMSMSRPIGYEGVTLVDTEKLRELERRVGYEKRVSSTEVKREPSSMEETRR